MVTPSVLSSTGEFVNTQACAVTRRVQRQHVRIGCGEGIPNTMQGSSKPDTLARVQNAATDVYKSIGYAVERKLHVWAPRDAHTWVISRDY